MDIAYTSDYCSECGTYTEHKILTEEGELVLCDDCFRELLILLLKEEEEP